MQEWTKFGSTWRLQCRHRRYFSPDWSDGHGTQQTFAEYIYTLNKPHILQLLLLQELFWCGRHILTKLWLVYEISNDFPTCLKRFKAARRIQMSTECLISSRPLLQLEYVCCFCQSVKSNVPASRASWRGCNLRMWFS